MNLLQKTSTFLLTALCLALTACSQPDHKSTPKQPDTYQSFEHCAKKSYNHCAGPLANDSGNRSVSHMDSDLQRIFTCIHKAKQVCSKRFPKGAVKYESTHQPGLQL